MKNIWNKIKEFFLNLPLEKWLLFVAGLIVAAFFNIALGMAVCIVPTVFLGFIVVFIGAWKSSNRDWWNMAATVIGGAIIQLFQILGHLWIG